MFWIQNIPIHVKAELCRAECLPGIRHPIIVATLRTAPVPGDAQRREGEVLWSEGRMGPGDSELSAGEREDGGV